MKRKKNSGSILMHVVLLALILIALILLAILIVHRIQLKNPAPAESAQPAETVLPSASPEPSETPAPTPTPTPEPDAAERLLAGMTTREKLCQLLVVQPEYLLTSYANVTRMTDGLRQGLRDYPVGGVLLTLPNMNGADQLTALTASLQESSSIPLILCLDEEGGEVSRLMQKVGTTKLDNMYTYRSKGAETARANGATLGRDLKRFGFNTDLAPVADVWSNPANKVIGERAYSDDFDEAAVLVSAAVQGFHDSDTICCLKHFPGHGSTRTDSHEEAAYVDATLAALRAHELLPFRSGIEAGADMVMVGHLTVPALDSVPATYSKKITTDLLRGELGFTGVVITDGLEMKAAGSIPDGQKALRALNAGCDLLLGLTDIPGTVEALEKAVASGELSAEDLDAHVLRVLRLKLQYGLLPDAEPA